MTDRDSLATKVATIQGPILDAARASFTDREIENLRCVVRLAVEFQGYMQRNQIGAIDPEQLDYVGGSVFAGVDSFSSVANAYRSLVGATSSRIDWNLIPTLGSPHSFRVYYLEMYEEFSSAVNFESKCHLLLDLFKLQLIFVAIAYNW